MGKYEAKKTHKKSRRPWLLVLLVLLALALAALLWVRSLLENNEIPELPQDAGISDGSAAPSEDAAKPGLWDSVETFEPVFLSNGLSITDIGSYAGVYMEDGTDETVSNVLMLVLENTSGQDLQLARIQLVYPDFTAEFETTNLPAGRSVVLLEQNRQTVPEEEYLYATAVDTAFFDTPMDLQEDRLSVTGYNGVIEVTNITEADIPGDVYLYYKNSSADLFYGGITYRARIEGGIPAGETVQVMTGHYTPDHCQILWITCGG